MITDRDTYFWERNAGYKGNFDAVRNISFDEDVGDNVDI